jgi:superfamily I DNA/RNA helicase
MKQCFRNTRQIVELGFNVLYGSQAKGVVKTRTFLDLDTLRNSSLISESASVVRVHFADRDGAEPFIKSFSSRAEEREWMTGEITRLVVEEYVRPSDILVLFRTDYDFEDLPAMIEEKLGPDRIKGFLRVFGKNAPDKDSYLIRDDHLTLSTVASAKGYDCPVVFLADLDRFEETSTDRALFYVGATRAKHMLYLLGLRTRSGQNTLLDEARLAQKALSVS